MFDSTWWCVVIKWWWCEFTNKACPAFPHLPLLLNKPLNSWILVLPLKLVRSNKDRGTRKDTHKYTHKQARTHTHKPEGKWQSHQETLQSLLWVKEWSSISLHRSASQRTLCQWFTSLHTTCHHPLPHSRFSHLDEAMLEWGWKRGALMHSEEIGCEVWLPPVLFLRGWPIDCCVCCCFLRSPSSLIMGAAFLCQPLAGNYSGAIWDCISFRASSDTFVLTLICLFVFWL